MNLETNSGLNEGNKLGNAITLDLFSTLRFIIAYYGKFLMAKIDINEMSF